MDREFGGIDLADAVKGVGDGGVVSGGESEGLAGELPAGLAGEGGGVAGVGAEFLDEGGIVGGVGDYSDVLEVLSGGADHGGATDVDVLDELGEGGAGAGGSFLEGIEVDDDHVDGLDGVGFDGGNVSGIVADVEDAAVDLGV